MFKKILLGFLTSVMVLCQAFCDTSGVSQVVIKNKKQILNASNEAVAKISFHTINSHNDPFVGLVLHFFLTSTEFNYLLLVVKQGWNLKQGGLMFIYNLLLKPESTLCQYDPAWKKAVENFCNQILPKINNLYPDLKLKIILKQDFEDKIFWKYFCINFFLKETAPYPVPELKVEKDYKDLIRKNGGILNICVRKTKENKSQWFVDRYNLMLLPQIIEQTGKSRPMKKYESISHYYNNVIFKLKFSLASCSPIIWIDDRTRPWMIGSHEQTIYLKIAETLKLDSRLFPKFISIVSDFKGKELTKDHPFLFRMNFKNIAGESIVSLYFLLQMVN